MQELSISTGEAIQFQGEQEIQGVFYTPEDGSLSIIIKDVFGVLIADLGENLSYPFTIADTDFLIPENELSKTYVVHIGFMVSSLKYNRKFRVQFKKDLPLNFTEKNILKALNAPDTCDAQDIDLYYAYSKVQKELGETFMTIPSNYLSDCRLVYLKSILSYLPTLVLHIFQTKRIDDHSETRFKVDMDKLYNQFLAEYNQLINSVYGIESEIDTLLSVVSTTDVITGENDA